jgi:hypothetical protein
MGKRGTSRSQINRDVDGLAIPGSRQTLKQTLNDSKAMLTAPRRVGAPLPDCRSHQVDFAGND